jgi:hypothetical protein
MYCKTVIFNYQINVFIRRPKLPDDLNAIHILLQQSFEALKEYVERVKYFQIDQLAADAINEFSAEGIENRYLGQFGWDFIVLCESSNKQCDKILACAGMRRLNADTA